MLKDINDSSLAKEEKALIKTFTEIVNQLRFDGNAERIQQALEDGTYYQVPVAIGSMKSQFHNKGDCLGSCFEFPVPFHILASRRLLSSKRDTPRGLSDPWSRGDVCPSIVSRSG